MSEQQGWSSFVATFASSGNPMSADDVSNALAIHGKTADDLEAALAEFATKPESADTSSSFLEATPDGGWFLTADTGGAVTFYQDADQC